MRGQAESAACQRFQGKYARFFQDSIHFPISEMMYTLVLQHSQRRGIILSILNESVRQWIYYSALIWQIVKRVSRFKSTCSYVPPESSKLWTNRVKLTMTIPPSWGNFLTCKTSRKTCKYLKYNQYARSFFLLFVVHYEKKSHVIIFHETPAVTSSAFVCIGLYIILILVG